MIGLDFETLSEQLKKQLDTSKQNWLFGAGISFPSNIPLMYPLTERVEKLIGESKIEKNIAIYKQLKEELGEGCHIEHYLSHLGDLLALADRSKAKCCMLGAQSFMHDEFKILYDYIIVSIGNTVRYGYSSKMGAELIGTAENPIVEIQPHLNFVQALYSSRSGVMSRSKLIFFTTNYDTLLEDALALEKFTVIDGFSGGGVGFWNPQVEFKNLNNLPNKCLLYKLHGSIDWHRDDEKGLIRARYGTKYLSRTSDIMIYPQATKYVETQKDPFSYLFSGFRDALNSNDDNILITCGYSFGDDHINAEIEAALSSRDSRTTLIAFAQECPAETIVINKILDEWIENLTYGNRIYVAGQKGLYYNSKNPVRPEDGKDLNWWTFEGLTNFILTGDHD